MNDTYLVVWSSTETSARLLYEKREFMGTRNEGVTYRWVALDKFVLTGPSEKVERLLRHWSVDEGFGYKIAAFRQVGADAED